MKATLFLQPRPSPSLAAVLFVAHLIAGITLWPLAMAVWHKSVLALLIALSAFVSIRRHALRRGNAVPVGLTFHVDGRVVCRLANGESFDARVASDSTVTPWLIVLRLKPTDGRRQAVVCLLPADSLSTDVHRCLRVWLRWHAAVLNAAAAV